MKFLALLLCGMATITFAIQSIGATVEPQEYAPGALGMTVPLLKSHRDLPNYVGRLVAIRGQLDEAKTSTLMGVEVSNSKDIRKGDAYAVGILVRHEATAERIAESSRRNGSIANRGPGISYTLYFDLSGKLADAKPWPTQ